MCTHNADGSGSDGDYETGQTKVSNPDKLEDMDDDNRLDKSASGRDFCLAILSNAIFLLGSTLYVALAVISIDWYKYKRQVPEEVLAADDDWTWYQYYNVTNYTNVWEDDYVFQAVKSNPDSWVSKSMMIYFAAATCFLFTGVLDWMRSPREWKYSFIMILAAAFGVASSMLVLENERLSIVFNSVSVHLFAVEAAFILFSRRTETLRIWLYFCDGFFVAGTFLDVVVSYFYVRETDELPHARASIAAALCWLTCAMMLMLANIYLWKQEKRVLTKLASPGH